MNCKHQRAAAGLAACLLVLACSAAGDDAGEALLAHSTCASAPLQAVSVQVLMLRLPAGAPRSWGALRAGELLGEPAPVRLALADPHAFLDRHGAGLGAHARNIRHLAAPARPAALRCVRGYNTWRSLKELDRDLACPELRGSRAWLLCAVSLRAKLFRGKPLLCLPQA